MGRTPGARMPVITNSEKNAVTVLLLAIAGVEAGCVYFVQNSTFPPLAFWPSAPADASRWLITSGLVLSAAVQVLAVTLLRRSYFAYLSRSQNPALHASRILWSATSFVAVAAAKFTTLSGAAGALLAYVAAHQSHYTHTAALTEGLGDSSTYGGSGRVASAHVSVTGSGAVAGFLTAVAGATTTGQDLLVAALVTGGAVVDALISVVTACATPQTHLFTQFVQALWMTAVKAALVLASS